jgi:5-methylcytosine-specific restriction endonuclease McrA
MATTPHPVLLDPTRVESMTPGEVLTAVVASRARERAEAAHQLVLACAWADQHPALEPGEEATLVAAGPDGGVHLPISGDGCPQATEYAVAEFGAVLGESTDTAKRLIGHALELRHRLPRLWALVLDGRTPAWRARLVAAETISRGLTTEAADWVDRQVAAVAGKLGTAAVMRVVDEAATRHGLPERPVADPQRLRVDLDGDDPDSGTVTMAAVLSTADGLDLDHALTHEAAVLKALGSDDDLDTRRAKALGHLARHQTALALFRDEFPEAGEPTTEVTLPAARELVLHLHFNATTGGGGGGGLQVDRLGRLEQGHRLTLLEHVRSWCGDSHTKVSIRPVIDLNTTLTAPGYAIPNRIRDHVEARDRTCMFPWCTRPARRCDLDHVVPFDHDPAADGRSQPGPTSTANLIPLCRRHHRLKTFTGWRVTMPTPGTTTWTSPHGHRFQRDPSGTTTLPPDKPPPR